MTDFVDMALKVATHYHTSHHSHNPLVIPSTSSHTPLTPLFPPLAPLLAPLTPLLPPLTSPFTPSNTPSTPHHSHPSLCTPRPPLCTPHTSPCAPRCQAHPYVVTDPAKIVRNTHTSSSSGHITFAALSKSIVDVEQVGFPLTLPFTLTLPCIHLVFSLPTPTPPYEPTSTPLLSPIT